MPRLVEADLAAPGDPEPRHQAVPLVGDRGQELNSVPLELGDSTFDVMAHEKELVLSDGTPPARPWMEGKLGRREGEDQPALAGVHGIKAQNVPKERSRRLRVLGEYDRVRPGEHRRHYTA